MPRLPERVERSGLFAGVRYTRISGDGSCLFAALSLALFLSTDRADALRAVCVQFVSENWPFYEALSSFLDVHSYRTHMSRASTWGGSCEASAIATIHHRRIIIVAGGSQKLLDAGPSSDPNPIFLRYSGVEGSDNFSGSHYDLYRGYPTNFDLRRDDENLTDRSNGAATCDSMGGPLHLVASGSISCKDPIFFPGAGDGQSVVVSAVALASQFLEKQFNEEMIDRIVHTGDTAFNTETLHRVLLTPQDLPDQITVNDPLVHVTITEKNHLTSYMYPHSENELANARKILLGKLTEILQTSPPHSSFLFQSPRGTSAFWEADGVFMVFDPNGLNETGCHDDNDEERNLARVFNCPGLQPLSQFLLQHPLPENGATEFFDIHRLRFCLSSTEKRRQPATPPPGSPDPRHDSDSDDTPLSARTAKRSRQAAPRKSRTSQSTPANKNKSVRPSNTNKTSSASKPFAESTTPLADSSDSDTTVTARRPKKGSASPVPPPTLKKPGRPRKKKRGRPASDKSKKEQQRERAQRYRDKQKAKRMQPDSTSVADPLAPTGQTTTPTTPLSYRQQLGTISRQKRHARSPSPTVVDPIQQQKRAKGRPKTLQTTTTQQHREAVRRYDQKHPDKHREAVRRYDQKHPDKHREAVHQYDQRHPEKHREAVHQYDQRHPEEVQDRRQRHVERNPEARQDTQRRYRAAHPDRCQIRHLTPEQRTAVVEHGPAAFWSGAQLDLVQPYRLKHPNLYGSDVFKCPYCGARLFDEEPHTSLWCCGKGAYNVLNLPPLEAQFYENPEFRERARAYNDLLSFCAMNVTGGYRHLPGLSFFKIEGRLYHQIYNLNAPGQSFRPRGGPQQFVNHCRLYIDDGEERRHLAEGRGLSPVIIDAATSHLLAKSPYVDKFRLLHAQEAPAARLDFQVNTRATHGPVLGDRNPGREVHAVLTTDEQMSPEPRHLTVWKHADRSWSYISVFSALMEPFQYPLLYPEGTPGWEIGRLDNHGKKLSSYRYSRCLLLSEPRFSELGRLSQAWQVEMFARYEEEQLRYLARVQGGDMRIAPASEVTAHLDQQQQQQAPQDGPPQDVQVQRDLARDLAADIAADETIQGGGAVPPGKIFLPSTHTGSKRYYKRKYLNAMGLVSRKGGPTYFLTFTACGQWDELRQSTRHGDKCDPSTCCRVFHIKLKELLRDIRTGALFGRKAYILYVIEMQMRGLPHAHIAIRVEDGGPKQGRDIDRVIRADIPGPEEAGGRLRPLVLKHMLHGPCGPAYGRSELPCWDSKKLMCNKYFPKPHNETTHTDGRGFVQYRRNHQNTATTTYRRRQHTVHDGWIVPWNAFLLLKYDAHINLEISSTRKVIKYLFKYMHKGVSKQNVRVTLGNDVLNEPLDYATKRMLGASDACWRLLDFDLTVSDPGVTMLPVHLRGQQTIVFRKGQEAEAVANSSSALMIYYNRPRHPVFDDLTYQDFYENFIVHTKRPRQKPGFPVYAHPSGKHFITPRQRGECVTRIFWVGPNRGELYYLRVLLCTLPCRGEADLIARGGEGCTTLQEAARRLGLVDNEQEYLEALREAAEFMVGPRLRDFFVMLANIGAPAAVLWEQFKEKLCEDHLEKHPDDPSKAFKLGLIQIDRGLRRNGSSLTQHGLPDVRDDSTELGRHLLNFSEETQQRILDQWQPLLSQEQSALLDHVKALVDDTALADASRTLFLDGPGGYGKTLVLKVILAYLRSKGKVALCVATSGIAAQNMEGGSTAHAMFRLPLDLGCGVGTWSLTNGTQRAELIRAADLIIFDEAPMAHRHLFEMVDRSLRDLMGNDLPFGGKIFLCSGDFRQIAPVVEEAHSPSDVISASLKSSTLWPLFKTFALTVPQRTRGSEEYSAFLLTVGDGTLAETTFGEGREQENLIKLDGIRTEDNLDTLINSVYPPDVLKDPDTAAERAILAPLLVNVHEVNDKVLGQLEGQQHQLLSYDKVDTDGDDGFVVDEDTLHLAKAKGAPDHVLTLKEGAVCLITRNLNMEQGLVNGTKVIIQTVGKRLIRVRKPGESETFGIPRISFQFPIIEGSPLNMTRRQFPLQLAYSMTIHKSQGQTIKQVGLDLRTDSFTHGQLYVALSRVRSPDHIRVLLQEDRVHHAVAYTKNIVYRDLLE